MNWWRSLVLLSAEDVVENPPWEIESALPTGALDEINFGQKPQVWCDEFASLAQITRHTHTAPS